MSDFDWDAWRKHIKETESVELIRSMSLEQLSEHLQFFITARDYAAADLGSTEHGLRQCNERIDWLRGEIQHRRSRKPSWVAIVSLIVALAGLCLGIYNCSQTSSDEERPTPTPAPQLSPTETASP